MPTRILHGSVLMEYHHKLMPFAWSILIDTAIFAAIYSQKPYFLALHAVGAAAIGAITIVTSFTSFLKGIPPVGNPMRTHKMVGTFLYLLIILQVIVGILWWAIRSSPTRSKLSIRLKQVHKMIGYSLAIVAKLQVLYILSPKEFLFWFNLIWDFITITLLVRSKRSQILSEARPQLSFNNSSFRMIKNLSEISQNHPETFMYGNYVFDCQSMKSKHPAGYQIILEQRDQCIDRYIYGMMGPESLPSMKLHSHSIKALEMMINPIAKLQVSEQYLNLRAESYAVQIQGATPICTKSGNYVLKLRVLQDEKIQYQGYSTIEQLGRYYSLTLNKQMTRLYTTVNFLLPQNIALIQKVFPKLVIPDRMESEFEENSSLEEVEPGGQSLHSKETLIPLIIKKYNNGRFTKKLLQNEAKELTLSCSKGRGLQLGEVRQGTIVVVAGGTGLLPFSDLIDLLFKQQLMAHQPELKAQILNKNKILRMDLFTSNNFQFLIAVNYFSEVHPITLNQLRYLSLIPEQYQVRLRIKDSENIQEANFKIERTPFQVIVGEYIQRHQIAKILVCGPEKLNRAMQNVFSRQNFTRFLIL